jgi:hypothetical protein
LYEEPFFAIDSFALDFCSHEKCFSAEQKVLIARGFWLFSCQLLFEDGSTYHRFQPTSSPKNARGEEVFR